MSSPIIRLEAGRIRGAVKFLFDGSPYYSFRGIPYAQPPVGRLRFKAPVLPKPWQNILDASEHGPICPQIERPHNKHLKSDENCLFLNVYSRSIRQNQKSAVMVFIHGGGYMTGSGNSEEYGPELLLQHDVVLVTLNYRLELFGFLCLDTPEIPGNAGMKDQVAALRWVQKNIEQFGGDPNNVTIFGESAGATSVTYHMLSSMSKGLFHRAIAQSGVCICDWAQGKDSNQRAFRVGKVLGKETNDTKVLLEFLQDIPTEQLINKLTYKTFTKDEKHRGLPIAFSPVVEKKFDGVESFLNEDPMNLLLSGKINRVPLIVGYNSSEAIVLIAHQQNIIDFTNRHPGFSIPREIALNVSKEQLDRFGKRLKSFYVGDRDFTKEDVQALCNKETDANFLYNTHRFTSIYSRVFEELYMYRFSCETELNLTKKFNKQPQVKGACHVDELHYLFSNNRVTKILQGNEECKIIVDRMTKLWTNFAKTGEPTPDDSLGFKWSQYTATNKEFLNMDRTFSVGKFADRERVEFWNSLYSEVGLPCIVRSSL